MLDIVISENEEGQRLDKFLNKYFKEAGTGFLYKMLRKKNIVLNGKRAGGNEKLVSGNVISIFMSDETIRKFRGDMEDALKNDIVPIDIITDGSFGFPYIMYKNYHIDILYEDRNIIFLNKPAGILSQKAKKEDVSIAEILESYLIKTGQISSDRNTQKPGVCSRLDRNTSGVMACGKSLKGLQSLTKAIRERTVSKYYRCIVMGVPKGDFILSGYLIKDNTGNKVYVSDIPADENASCKTGKNYSSEKYARTEFKVIETYGNNALVEAKLITGRTHQIRAHLAYKGYPIAGDIKYGAEPDNTLRHYLLHSYELKFGKEEGVLSGVSEKVITAPLPKEFIQYIQQVK